jgi:hypothetical protein
MKIGFNYLGRVTAGRGSSCEHGNEHTFGFHIMVGISWLSNYKFLKKDLLNEVN